MKTIVPKALATLVLSLSLNSLSCCSVQQPRQQIMPTEDHQTQTIKSQPLTKIPSSVAIDQDFQSKIELIERVRRDVGKHFGISNDKGILISPHYSEYVETKSLSKRIDYILHVAHPLKLIDNPENHEESFGEDKAYRKNIATYRRFSSIAHDTLEDEMDYYLREKGMDVYRRVVTDFNTPGMSAAITDSFLENKTRRQTENIWHETTHYFVRSVLNKKNIGRALSEAIATIYGFHGAMNSLCDEVDSQDCQEAIDAYERYKVRCNSCNWAWDELNKVYENPKLSNSEKLSRRRIIFFLLREKAPEFKFPNNAHLTSRRTYCRYFPFMDEFAKSHEYELSIVTEFLKRMPNNDEDAIRYFKNNMGVKTLPPLDESDIIFRMPNLY